MLFNSNNFLIFFLVFWILYFLLIEKTRARNVIILVASCIFYGSWSIAFLGLMLFTATADYAFGLLLARVEHRRGRLAILISSLLLNLGILGYFKYSLFVAEILDSLTGRAPFAMQAVILPVGISFYTFQSISYVIDVYRRTIPADRNWVRFMAFVSFFPQLVAGPIERASHLLPQFRAVRLATGGSIQEGVWLFLWGMFKKVVIADNLAVYSDMVFGKDHFPLGVYLLASIAFGIQIYCDFSGYSDIARGLGKILGYDIMFNFNIPYSATSVREFWTRWHISLSGWFRDYVYIPLGGNRGGVGRTSLNLFIVMAVAGLWHGANWTFVLWGIWHGLALVLNHSFRQADVRMPSWIGWMITMSVVLVGWIFFRATSLQQLYTITFLNRDAGWPMWIPHYVVGLCVFALPLVAVETIQRVRRNLAWPAALPFTGKALLYGPLLSLVLLDWEKEGTPFIYFQF